MGFPSTSRRGFTLVELLVVLAIVAILAGMLFPVFSQARRSAQTVSCLSNFHNVTRASTMYVDDYDEGLFPMNHRPGAEPDARYDRVWPQLLLPYAGSFGVFDCPAGRNSMDFGGSFDPDLLPGDYAARFYQAALHSDVGYNAYYLAPVVRTEAGWIARPKTIGSIPNPASTLLFVESRDGDRGSYVVSPPCRYVADHGYWVDTFQAEVQRTSWRQIDPVFTPITGWDLETLEPGSGQGGVGTRHGERLNVAYVDGSARTVSMSALTQGCDVQTEWRGTIQNATQYPWDVLQ